MPVPLVFTDLSETPTSNSPAGSEPVGPLANDYFQAAFAFIRMLYDGQQNPTAAVQMNGQTLSGLANGVVGTDAATVQQVTGTLGAPSGTRMIFQQFAAPLGWVVDANAALLDCSLRFNAPSAGVLNGSVGWSSWNFGAAWTTNGTALSIAEMPGHQHIDTGHNHSVNDPTHGHTIFDPGHSHTYTGFMEAAFGGGSLGALQNVGQTATFPNTTGISINASATGVSLNPAAASISFTGGGEAHAHTITTPQVKYADCCVAVKS